MTGLILGLLPLACAIALLATWAARAVGHRLHALDGAGIEGQVKAPVRRVPNTGGVGIMAGLAIPLVGLLVLISLLGSEGSSIDTFIPADARAYLSGFQSKARDAWIFLGGLLLLHILGVVDDRKPLGPWLKLVVMASVSLAVLVLTSTRMFTFLDAHAGGPWASYACTLLWVLVVTNAMNFLDNMDALSGGVGAVASACFLTIALEHQQWFIAGGFALLLGSILGFLVFNRPPASIFMGDGGSLVIGFVLALLSVRITYVPQAISPTHVPWYAVLAPVVVLAVPLYDCASVVFLRLRQGKSPLVGDLQHLSHRFVQRGLTRPMAVLVICGFAGVCGVSGVLLSRLERAGDALLIACMIALLFGVIALMEFSPRERQTP
jgi:UDP-GlcNAc:undecaprenyl-phosphate/decaprenyl-phosphate GlcNAc-1-phosphate transferase